MSAQQLLALTTDGRLISTRVDGALRRDLGVSGLAEGTALATFGPHVVLAGRVANQRRLSTLDPVTGVTLHTTATSERFAALYEHPTTGQLFGIVDRADGDDLTMLVSTTTGAVASPRVTGFTAITAVGRRFNQLIAWDRIAGLLHLDPDTGVATDPFPSVGGQGISLEFLLTDDTGRLLGGNSQLFSVQTDTGLVIRLASLTDDLRGAMRYAGRAVGFGTPCGGAAPLALAGDAIPGTSLDYTALPGARLAPGVLYLGASRESFRGQPLPLSLDGLFGTRGCNLLVSPDVPVPMSTDLTGRASLRLPLHAPGFAVTLHAQHFALAGDQAVASSGVTVEIAR